MTEYRLWATSGHLVAPDSKNDDELDGNPFQFQFAGPANFNQAHAMAAAFAVETIGAPDDFGVEIDRLEKVGWVWVAE